MFLGQNWAKRRIKEEERAAALWSEVEMNRSTIGFLETAVSLSAFKICLDLYQVESHTDCHECITGLRRLPN